MTLTIDLTPEEEHKLRDNACAEGKPLQDYIRGVIASLPTIGTVEDRTDDIFAQWAAEDAAMTPDEIEAERADWERTKANMNSYRAENGERLIFP